MTDALAGRVAVITGAGDGIGRGIARAYAREGAAVVVAELHEDTGKEVADELQRDFGARAIATVTDVADRDAVDAMVAAAVSEFGQVDILVNNAWGGGELSRVEHKTHALLEQAFKVGYYGPLWAMQAAFPGMAERGYGRIINICSLNGVNAHMGTLEYNSAKEALRTSPARRRGSGRRTGIVAQRHLPRRQVGCDPAGLRRAPRTRGGGRCVQPNGPAR